MILLYSVLVAFLSAIQSVLSRRAGGLERAYSRVATEAEQLRFTSSTVKQGNSQRTLDTYETAKRQYQLGRKVEQRDALEALWQCWQLRADWFGRMVAVVREWKGRKLPYTMGLADMSCLLWLIDRAGVERLIGWEQWLQQAYLWVAP